MSLLVDVYFLDEADKMNFQDPKVYSETLAGPETWRTELYGSNTARRLGLTLLPTLASQDIYASGADVNKLKAEAEVVLNSVAAFAEENGLEVSDVQRYGNNIRLACIRARHIQGNVVIW